MTAEASRQVENLVYLYAERLDAGDLDGVGALFESGAYGVAGGPAVEGSTAVAELLRSQVLLHEDGTPRTRHVTSNVIVEAGSEAGETLARSSFTVFQHGPDRPLAPIVLGRYADRFGREGDTWQFRERRIFIDWVGDLSDHLRRPGIVER